MANIAEKVTAEAIELSVVDLSIQRGSKVLLDRLSFAANSGDLIWITGTNGSGKTSLLKCIAGLIRADNGHVGWDSQNSSLAFLGHNDAHKGNLTVCENLEFWHGIFGSSSDLEDVMKLVDIWHLRDLEAKKLSAGQSRRVAFARLLLKEAKLWLLDEPAAPMDSRGREMITDFLETHLSLGGIALIATHSVPFKIGFNAHVLNLGARQDA